MRVSLMLLYPNSALTFSFRVLVSIGDIADRK